MEPKKFQVNDIHLSPGGRNESVTNEPHESQTSAGRIVSQFPFSFLDIFGKSVLFNRL